MKRITLLALAALPMLSGCGGTVNRGLESVHQPVVSRTDYVFDAQTSGSALADGEARRLGGWLASMRLSYGDRVAIDDPSGGYGPREQVTAELSRFGLLLDDHAPITTAPIAPGMIRIVVTRVAATVPHCPDWSRDESTDFNANTSSNQGCATNSNLAAIVANPLDLVRGETGSGTIDATSNTKAIDTYRKQTPTGAAGLKAESTGGH